MASRGWEWTDVQMLDGNGHQPNVDVGETSTHVWPTPIAQSLFQNPQ